MNAMQDNLDMNASTIKYMALIIPHSREQSNGICFMQIKQTLTVVLNRNEFINKITDQIKAARIVKGLSY